MPEVSEFKTKAAITKEEYITLLGQAAAKVNEEDGGVKGISVVIAWESGDGTTISRAEDSTSLLGHMHRACVRMANFLESDHE